LWPWGGGNPLREPLAAAAPGAVAEGARWARVWSDDAWVSALGALAGAVVEPLPPDDGQGAALEPLLGAAERSVCAVVPLSGRGLAAFDRGFIAPAVRALQEGRIGRLTVAANDRAVRVERGDRWRLWRPQRDLLEAVAEGGA
ncbi:MAG: hypothetical protein EBS39_12560, partial [Gammaproteobacteria bacterium]|nr:hypothetical protein [Gammaproteobacteria bacterium]